MRHLKTFLIIWILHQGECVNLNDIFKLWRTIPTTETTTTIQPTLKTVIITRPPTFGSDAYEFKGIRHDRTESSLYPTTPSEGREFEKWEQEQEKKYVEEVLGQITSQNDTVVEHEAKEVISNILVSKAKDNAMNYHKLFQEDGTGEKLDRVHIRQEDFNKNSKKPQISQEQQPITNNRFPILSQVFSNMPRITNTIGNRDPVQTITNFFQPIMSSSSNAIAKFPSSVSNYLGTFGKTPAKADTETKPSAAAAPSSSAMESMSHLMEQQMKILRENLKSINFTETLNQSLKLASENPVSISSVISGITALVRCNTVGLVNRICDPTLNTATN